MARCRVYLFTYKRDYLLPRAVKSLLAQTFNDWVCEVHNDAPENSFPLDYINSLNDPRFTVITHPVNLGGTASFNLAFAGCNEAYASILEDDNWWEPGFLQDMIQVMDNNSAVSIAWSNMKVWKELPGNQWQDTGRLVWNDTIVDTLYTQLHRQQATSALHSIGAMIYRGANAANHVIPDNCDLSIIEPIREKTFALPIYLNIKPLANFSATLATARSKNPYIWTAGQAMLLSSFVASAHQPDETFKASLNYYRNQRPSPIAGFFLANLFFLKKASLYKLFKPADWFAIGRWLVKNFFKLPTIKKYLSTQQNVYEFLLKHTRLRHEQATTNPIGNNK